MVGRYKRLTKNSTSKEDDVYEEKKERLKPCLNGHLDNVPQVAQREYGPQMGNRGRLMKSIKILGEEGYLWEVRYNVNPNPPKPGVPSEVITSYVPCSLKRKIKYLNTSSWVEVGRDYDNFVTDAYDNGLFVDRWGDSYFMD